MDKVVARQRGSPGKWRKRAFLAWGWWYRQCVSPSGRRNVFPEEDPVAKTTRRSTDGLELPPLRQGKHFPEIKIHGGGLAFQLASRIQHLVNLGADLTLIRDIGVQQGLQLQILFF